MRAAILRLTNAADLKTRVIAVVVVVLITSVWGFAIHVSQVLRTDLQHLVSDHLQSMVRIFANDFDEGIIVHGNALADLAASLTPEMLERPERAQVTLERLSIPKILFPVGLFIVDRYGAIIAEGGPSIPGRRGRMVADQDYFRKTLATSKPVTSSPFIGNLTKRPAIAFTVPLRSRAGEIAGMLVGTVNVDNDTMFGELDTFKLGKNGYVVMISPEDRLVISATDKNRIMKPVPARGTIPLMDRRLDEGFEGAGTIVNSSGAEVLTASQNMRTTGWIVIAGLPTEEAFAPIDTIRRNVYLAAFFITLVVALLLGIVLQRQLAPLEEAGNAMQRMTEGKEDFAVLPIRRKDEIGRMVGHFNQLVAGRKLAEEELRRHRDHLQELIDDQTADLVRAKDAAERASRAKGNLLANVSHELRTPLQVILSFAELGHGRTGTAERGALREYFGNIQSSGKELSRLIGDLLDLSRFEVSKVVLDKSACNIMAIARDIGREMSSLLSARDLALEFDEPDGALVANVDGLRIAQVLRNLLSNAIKFSPPGGCIRICAAATTISIEDPTGRSEEFPALRLSVSDAGDGIPENELESVFGKFVQSSVTDPSAGGTGLGLAICREIVEAHGGRIAACNNAAGGATIEVTVPISSECEITPGSS